MYKNETWKTTKGNKIRSKDTYTYLERIPNRVLVENEEQFSKIRQNYT